MAGNEVQIKVTSDTTQAQQGLGKLQNRLGNVAQRARGAGIAFSAFGAGGILAIKSLTGAAMEQQRAISTLAAMVESSGTSYDTVSEKVLATTAALQAKTNFGDEAQIRALTQLVPIFGNVDDALSALPVLLDAASSSGKSLETVVSTMGRALSGATNTSIILGTTFDKTATFADRLAIAQAKVGGAAEANADPMVQLGNTMGDLKEVIGDQLLPVILPLIKRFTEFIGRLQNMNPTMLKVISLVTLGAVAFATIMGPILLLLGILPAMISGIAMLGTVITIATGPVGLIVLAIAAVVAGGLLLIANWDTIRTKATEIFGRIGEIIVGFKIRIVEVFKGVANVILQPFRDFAGTLAGLMAKLPAIIADRIPGFSSIRSGLLGFAEGSFAHGGIVRRPTVALIGERGPEAIVPLNAGGAGAGIGGITIVFNAPVYGVDDFERTVARVVRDHATRGGFHGLGFG